MRKRAGMEKQESKNADLDLRMTDECKAYVTNSLKVMRPIDAIKLDLNFLRQTKDVSATETNKLMAFDGLDIVEFTVTNPKDNFNIKVICKIAFGLQLLF